MKRTDGDAADYVARALALDLAEESAQVVALRQAFLAPGGKPSDDKPPLSRADAREALERLRESFWGLGETGFAAHAPTEDCGGFPDLDRQLARLSDVDRARAAFDRADADPDVDAAHLQMLRAIVIASPRQAVALKAEWIEGMRVKARRKRAQKTVRVLAERHPAVHRLEERWLREVLEVQKTLRASARSSGGVLLAFGGFLFMRALYEIVKNLT